MREMETRLTQQLQAYDANASTRLVNSQHVRRLEHVIEPLVTVADGADIPDFPETVNEIMAMSGMYTHLDLLVPVKRIRTS